MSSLRRSDLLALANLRNDGRRPNEIRRTVARMGALTDFNGACCGATGSALVSMGLTSALAFVRGPIDCVRRSDELPDRAVLDVSIRTTPYAPPGDRRHANPNTDRRLVEQSNLIRRALEPSILLDLHPRSRIEVVVIVLSDDGGRLCASINAASLALVDSGVPLRDVVCSCSAGLVCGGAADGSDVAIVDLNRTEVYGGGGGGGAAVYLPVAAMVQRGTVVLAQCESRLSVDSFVTVLDAALEGCRAVWDAVSAGARERGSTLLAARNGDAVVECGV